MFLARALLVILTLGLAPLAADAQPARKVLEAFRKGPRELGYVEGLRLAQ